jgi:imidazolonepropionase-like amidohydrolase
MVATYLADVTLFDGRAVKAKHGVLVQDGVIAWVGPHARVPRAARSATEVQGDGRAVTPGLIDCHVHLQFDGGANFEAEGRSLTPATAALKAAENLKRHLAHGVTTVRDLGGIDAVSCEVGLAVDRGLIPGPRVLAAGRALTVTGGHGHNVAIAREVDGADAMRKAVREEIRAGAKVIKVIATGGVLTPGIGATFTAYTPEELSAAVDEAHSWGLGVAAHAIGAEGIRYAVLAGVDSIEHGTDITPAIAREMKARGTFRSPTICALRGILDHAAVVPAYAVEKATQLQETARASHVRAIKAGVPHVCGTDAGTPFNPHGNGPQEIVYMVEWGMTPLAAMRAATANGARLLRVVETGTLEQGKVADLVMYDTNPVEDIRGVLEPRTVWKAGRRVGGRPGRAR